MSEAWRQPADTVRHVNVHVRLFAATPRAGRSGTPSSSSSPTARRSATSGPRSTSATSPPGSSTRVTGHTSSEPQSLEPGDEVAVIPPVSGGDFRLSADPLSVDAAVAEVRDDAAGAIATFIGTTRARSRGRDVVHLEYEAYEGMAEQVMADLAAQLADRHELCRVAIHHRVGRVDIGETSVVIAVSAPHRAAALAACARGDRRAEGLRPALEEGDVRGR